MSSRATVGGNQSPDSLGSKYALPQHSILSSCASFELSEIRKPSPDELELGSGLLFASIFILPGLFVFGVAFFYLALVSQAADY